MGLQGNNSLQPQSIVFCTWYGTKKWRALQRATGNDIVKLDYANVHCIQTSFSVLYLVGNLVVFTNFVNKTRNMNENILTTSGRSDETKSFGFIEKLNCTFLHSKTN